jgi:hypothetical protein
MNELRCADCCEIIDERDDYMSFGGLYFCGACMYKIVTPIKHYFGNKNRKTINEVFSSR